jgi:pantothenate kinase-related protein Tda10
MRLLVARAIVAIMLLHGWVVGAQPGPEHAELAATRSRVQEQYAQLISSG